MKTYVINPLADFPKRWKDKDGGRITVMAGPVKGWLMVRRPRCDPFTIQLGELLNQKKHLFGPFDPAEKAQAA